jgi:AcrR family transcriptional regulator
LGSAPSARAGTRERILDAACEIFAERGFHGSTIADICDRADANIAAVNYYFRHKDSLYKEAWQAAFERSMERHPPDGGVPADAPPEERLRGRIRSIVARIADPESLEFEIVHKEMANPTGLLHEVMPARIEPIRRGLMAIIRDLLGPSASEQTVNLCHLSIISQCFGPMLRIRRVRVSGERLPVPHPPDLEGLAADALAEHIVRFSLAGLADTRRRLEAGAPGAIS